MKFVNPSQMTVPLYSQHQHTISTTEFKALSFEQRSAYLERHDSKRHILKAANELIEAFNYNSAEKNLIPVILAMDENKTAAFFRYFVYASIPLAEKLTPDLRNQATVDFFKKLITSPFDSIEINMPFSAPTKFAMTPTNTDFAESIRIALEKFLTVVDKQVNDMDLSESETASILATAISQQHPTNQQSLVRSIFNSGIALAGAYTSRDVLLTNTSLLVIVKTFCQLSEEVYFPYV